MFASRESCNNEARDVTLRDEEKVRRNAVQLLQAHQHRRLRNIPTLSTIVGPLHVVRSCVHEAFGQGNSGAGVVPTTHTGWLSDYVQFLHHSVRLKRASENWFKNVAPELVGMQLSGFDRRQLFRRVGTSVDAVGDDGLACRLFEWYSENAFQNRATKASVPRPKSGDLLEWLRQYGNDWETLASITELLADRLPCMRMQMSVDSAGDTLSTAARLVIHAPRLPLVLCAESKVWNDALASLGKGFARAVATENVIEIASHEPCQSNQRSQHSPTATSNRKTGDTEALLQRLHRAVGGVSERCVGALVRVLEEPSQISFDQQSSAPPVDSHAPLFRSAHEEFLYEMLSAHADLHGLFDANVKQAFCFGSRPAEIDLCCQSLKIAIEVDGYYHFQDASQYRVDRRKDLILQRHGFLVLRFLADDVVREMETILETVSDAVDFRRGQSADVNS